MRPLKLSVKGLRSYRQHQEIDFSDASLVAILGDTGAGKSSILEAICVALYAAPTWDKRNVKALISSGLPALEVELEFLADGRQWRVHRSLPAGTYPPAAHTLLGLTDGSRIDGAREVSERVQELVGLDYDAFLRAVLLPQGRFQALLQATEGQRTAILKGIFRLDLLDRVREIAGVKLAELEPLLLELRTERGALLADPEAAAAEAERRREEAEVERTRLEAAHEALAAAAARRDDLRRRASALADATEPVTGADLGPDLASLARLVARADELDATRRELARRARQLERDRAALAAGRREAEEAGLGYEAVLGAAGALADTLEWLRAAAGDAEAAKEARAELARARETLAARREEIAALEQEAAAARGEVEREREARDEARAKVEEARRRWAAAGEAAERLRGRQRTAAARNEELAKVERELASARREAQAAAESLGRAEEALAESHRRHATAHAAAGSEAGDPCPVCERRLPASWRAPVEPDAAAAESALDQARRAQAASQSRLAKLEARAGGLAVQHADDRAETERAEGELAAKVALLREIAGKRASAEMDEEALLGPLAAALAKRDESLDRRERRARELDGARGERQAAAERIDADARSLAQRLETDEKRLARDREERQRRLRALPARLRPAALEAAALEEASEIARRELTLAKQRSERWDAVTGASADAQRALGAHQERCEQEVSRPAREIGRRLAELRHRLVRLAAQLDSEAPPASEGESAGEAAAWARELDAARGRLVDAAAKRAKQLDGDAGRAEKEIRAALAAAGAPDEKALAAAHTAVAVALQRAGEDVETARRQAGVARGLDRRIAAGAPLVEALQELRSLLTDGRFVGYVVERKQRSLLAISSKLLGEMTNHRYGFAEDFQVLDRLAGEPRSTKTLSGGETFLASLALALGLVELAGREGGRLDSLFLDEGFGSLDANALAEALDALHEQAARGRMVAVISHLHAVAENIDRVLLVSRTPAGSRAEWLNEAARAELVEEEASAGLLV